MAIAMQFLHVNCLKDYEMPPKIIFTSVGQQTVPELIRMSELVHLLPLSSATIWRKAKNGSFPHPIKLSDRITAWSRAEVIEWINKKGAR